MSKKFIEKEITFHIKLTEPLSAFPMEYSLPFYPWNVHFLINDFQLNRDHKMPYIFISLVNSRTKYLNPDIELLSATASLLSWILVGMTSGISLPDLKNFKPFIPTINYYHTLQIRGEINVVVKVNVKEPIPPIDTVGDDMECPICMQNLRTTSVSSTKCGHVFCTQCIQQSLLITRNCPSCNQRINLKHLRPIFFPS